MSSRDGRTQVAVEIPTETKQALKDADSPMWKIIDEGARLVLGLDEGSTEAAIEQRLQDVRQERNQINSQMEDLESRILELEEMESDLADQLDSIREKKQSHKERLDEILDEMESDPDNRPVMAWMSELREAATKEYGSESRDNMRRVVEDLRSRSTEQARGIVPARFSRAASAQTIGASADGGNDPDEFRVLSDGRENE